MRRRAEGEAEVEEWSPIRVEKVGRRWRTTINSSVWPEAWCARKSTGRRLIGRSVSWLVGWLIGRSVSQSVGRSVDLLQLRSVVLLLSQ